MSDKSVSTSTAISKVDPRTGKVLTIKGEISTLKPPAKGAISSINKVAGKNPPVNNLDNHVTDWNGMDIVTVDDASLFAFADAEWDGKKSEYVTFVAWICPPGRDPEGEPLIIRTGAANVYGRLLEAYLKDALPVRGALRAVPTRRGKMAWFLD